MTTWRPDTCDCVIEVETSELTERCSAHTELDTSLEGIYEENRGKNKVLQKLSEIMGVEEAEVDVPWSFDQNRILKVRVRGVNPSVVRPVLEEIYSRVEVEIEETEVS